MIINLTTPMSGDEERERHTKAVINAIEQYTEERMADEYGRIHTDGNRSGGEAVVDTAMLEALQKAAGIPHLPTQETYQFRMAVSGEGPLAHQWSDKPHRLLYDACSIIESAAAQRQPTQSDVNERLGAWLSAALDDPNCSDAFKQDINDWFASQPTQSDADVLEEMRFTYECVCSEGYNDRDYTEALDFEIEARGWEAAFAVAVAKLRQPTQSDAEIIAENKRLREALKRIQHFSPAYMWRAPDIKVIIGAALQEKSK